MIFVLFTILIPAAGPLEDCVLVVNMLHSMRFLDLMKRSQPGEVDVKVLALCYPTIG